jgi:hypothetical protein
VLAQNGSNLTSFVDQDEVVIIGIIDSIDDHGFIIVSGSETFFVGIPLNFDKSVLELAIGSEVTVTGYIVESSMMNLTSYPTLHATSINGVVIDHNSQMQSRSGDCDGNGGMSGHGNKQNGSRNRINQN